MDVAVKEFKDKKFLSTVRNESTIEPIDDIGVVVEDDEYDDEVPSSEASNSTNAKVIAVVSLTSFKGCLGCGGRIETDGEEEVCRYRGW